MSTPAKKPRKLPAFSVSLVWMVVALTVAGLTFVTIGSPANHERIKMLVETGRSFSTFDTVSVDADSSIPSPASPTEAEVMRLADELTLAKVSFADLSGRVQALEDALGPMTASIGREEDAPRATAAISIDASDSMREILLPSSEAEDEMAVIPVPDVKPMETEMAALESTLMDLPEPEPEMALIPLDDIKPELPMTAEISATDFALELAATLSLSDGRALWQEMTARYPDHLADLKPRISIVETDGGRLELRLLAGPIRNAGMAATLCGELRAMGQTCNNTVFEGQTLAMK